MGAESMNPYASAAEGAISVWSQGEAARAQKELNEKYLQLQRDQLEQQKKQWEAAQKAYAGGLSSAKSGLAETEGTLNPLFTSAGTPQEFKTMLSDVQTGKNENLARGAGELRASIAASGMRGGQAATQLRRGIGEMATQATRDVNSLISDEAIQRSAAQRAYLMNKAGTQNQFMYNPAVYASGAGA